MDNETRDLSLSNAVEAELVETGQTSAKQALLADFSAQERSLNFESAVLEFIAEGKTEPFYGLPQNESRFSDREAQAFLSILYGNLPDLAPGSALAKMLKKFQYYPVFPLESIRNPFKRKNTQYRADDRLPPHELLHYKDGPASKIVYGRRIDTEEVGPQEKRPLIELELKLDRGIFRGVNQISNVLQIDITSLGVVSGKTFYLQEIYYYSDPSISDKKEYQNTDPMTNAVDLLVLQRGIFYAMSIRKMNSRLSSASESDIMGTSL